VTLRSAGTAEELEQLGHVVERLPTGVILVDQARLEVLYANMSARRLLHPVKLKTRHPLPDPWTSFSLPRYTKDLINRGVAVEVRIEVDDDRIFLLEGLADRGERTAVILVRDVTEHNRRGRAEREFISNAAHELLTPLTGIVGAAHVLEAGAKDVPEDRDRFIAHIAAECNRLARISRSLLVLARAQSGEEPPRLEILLLRPVLEESIVPVEADIVVQCEPELTVFADIDLVSQAFTNLVANAARHGRGVTIVVDAREVAGDLVEVDVRTGADGDGDGDLTDLRARFRSGEGRDGGGFGLGLSIAEQSLEVMGGHLLLGRRGVRVRIPRGGIAPR
jgi:signal transduction histidine kinase